MYVCEISMKNSDLEYVINILLHGVLVRALIIIHHHLLGLQPLHGWKFKISENLNFQNSALKTCNMPTKYSQCEA